MEQEIKRALVADDEAGFRLKVERRILSKELGYHVEIALNADEVYQSLKNTKYNLVILGLDMDGSKQILLDLRNNHDWKTLCNVPIIALISLLATCFFTEELIHLVEDTNSILCGKPVVESELLTAIEKAYEKAKFYGRKWESKFNTICESMFILLEQRELDSNTTLLVAGFIEKLQSFICKHNGNCCKKCKEESGKVTARKCSQEKTDPESVKISTLANILTSWNIDGFR